MQRSRLSLILAITALILSTGVPPARPATGFEADVSRISPRLKERMTGKSWHKGCPVPIRSLRLIRVSYNGFDGDRHMGKVVVNKDAVDAIVAAFRSMYRSDFKIHHLWLVDRFDGGDHKSMRADNTSAFNCRKVAGSSNWSQHAYGRAIDINPVENPYVGSDGSVSPPNGSAYADRSRRHKGMIHSGDSTVRAFQRAGWGWGGNWSSAKDYQHFSSTGT